MKKTLIFVFVFLGHYAAQSQACRYLDEIFPSVKVTPDIVYGKNATILLFDSLHEAVPQPLILDVYEPEGDTLAIRPLIIYFHSGNFLPYPQNQSEVGTRRDSSSVEICKKLARRGYVVASADYRLGWNPSPFAPIADLRFGLINAAYRGLQDARTSIRFFKKTVAEDENPFKIDPDRIALFGDDTGGYLSVQASALSSFSEILSNSELYHGLLPMIAEYVNGDIEGKKYGINDPPYPPYQLAGFPVGDTLCYANYPEYSSSFRAAINLAGAVVDTSWIDYGEPPIFCAHVPWDNTTPYDYGIVYLGGVIPVIHVYGSHAIETKCNEIGNNNVAKIENSLEGYAGEFRYSVASVASTRNEGLIGLYPVYGDTITDITPWVYCDSDDPGCAGAKMNNPNMSKEKAVLYMDSIFAYILPQLYLAMDLSPIDPECIIINTKDLIPVDIQISLAPNPTIGDVLIQSPEDHIIRNIRLFDSKGMLVSRFESIDNTFYQMSLMDKIPGMYVMQIQFDQGIAARQILIH